MEDRVTYISLLTAAIEINNVIGHALAKTQSRMKECLPLTASKVEKGLV